MSSDLEQDIVGGHGELSGVQEEPFSQERKQTVTQHHLRLPPETGNDITDFRNHNQHHSGFQKKFFFKLKLIPQRE